MNAARLEPRRRLARVLIALALLPPLVIGLLMCRYCVDAPFWDHWDATAPLFQKMAEGRLHLADFFALHNEHRIVFARMIAFSLGKLTHWDTRAELFVIWCLALVCFFNLWKIIRIAELPRAAEGWGLLAISLLFFSPMGFENWLFGIQILFFLPVACMTMSLWIVSKSRLTAGFLWAILFSTICTFSFGSGFTTWLLLAPVLLFPEGRLRWRDRKGEWALYIAGFVACELLYFHDYSKPSYHPTTLLAFQQPVRAIGYVLVFLGSPFAAGTPFNALIMPVGALLLTFFGAAFLYLWRSRSDALLVKRTLPAMMLGMYALASAVLTMLGRLGFGLGQAQASRYTLFALFLPISLVMVVPAMFRHWKECAPAAAATPATRTLLRATAAFMTILYLLSCSFVLLTRWPKEQHLRLTTKALLACINIIDEPEALTQYVHDNTPLLRNLATSINRMGYLRPPMLKSNKIREVADLSLPGSRNFGAIQQAGFIQGGDMEVVGWAILPHKLRAADAVLLTYDDSHGDPTIFALATTGLPQVAVADALQESAYLRSGWAKRLKASRVPYGARIQAWAFDAEENRAFLMQGTATF